MHYYVRYTVLLEERESNSHKIVNGYNIVCERGTQEVNMCKNKLIVSEKKTSEVSDFADPFIVRTECQNQRMITLNEQFIEQVNEFIYIASILCK